MQKLNHQKAIVLIVVLVSLLLAQLPITGQIRPAGGRKRTAPPATPKKAQTPDPQKGVQTGPAMPLIRSRRAENMSQAMSDGKLPEPLRMPAGDIDERAKELSRIISRGDSNSTAALYAAILASGYGVRENDGSILQTTQRGQGIAFDAWEIAAISKLYGEGYGVTLEHLSDSFTQSVPEFRGIPLANMLLEGLRTGANSDHPAVRFWARSIVELGKHSSPAYDLLERADPGVRLDALQLALILKRLAGDLALLGRPDQQSTVKSRGTGNVRWQPVGFNDLAFNEEQSGYIGAPRWVLSYGKVGARTSSILPQCSPSDVEGLILDYSALGMTTAFGALLDYLKGKAAGADKLAKGVGLANIVLTIMKFVASYALLTTELIINGHPLERTKTTQPGKTATLSAKLQIDPTKWQILNCVRPALNAAGLDFDLPDSGPLKDVRVEWKLIVGGDSRGWLGTIQDIGQIITGNATWGDGIVYFDPLPGTDRSPAKQFTDSNGISRMNVVGVPQGRDLSREKLKKVDKVAGVRVDIQLKTTRISDATRFASTFGDIAGNVISFLTGDIPGGLVGTAAETLYRSNWRRSEPLYFLVYDWEPCEGWEGTISIKTELTQYEETTTSGIFSSTEKKHEFEATLNVTSVKDTSESFTNGYFADAVMRSEQIQKQVNKNPYEGGFCDTGQRTAGGSKVTVRVRGTRTTINTIENIGAGTGRGTVYISPRGAEGYNILIKPPPPYSGVYRRNFQYQFPQCPLWEKVNSSGPEEKPRTFGMPTFEFVATFDENGALAGSKTVKQGGGTVTYKWNLQKCK